MFPVARAAGDARRSPSGAAGPAIVILLLALAQAQAAEPAAAPGEFRAAEASRC
jgi:hypothetical protein